MSEIIIFGISLFFIIFFIGFRLIELKRGKDIFPSSFRKYCDKLVLKISYWFLDLLYVVWVSMANFYKKILHAVIHFFVDIWEFLVRKSVKYIDSIRGRGVLRKKGSASFFLNSLEEYKRGMRK